MKSLVGSQFGKYHVLSLVGRGGMGVVYLAEDSTLGRRIALKVLDRSVTEDGQFERRFQQEARTIASLQHPNIVTIHALEKIDGVLAIDMPYIDGGSMVDALRDKVTGRELTIAGMRDALMALACRHQDGIVHRDVKPSNILICGDGVALLSDFGLAKLLAEQQANSLSQTSSSGYFLGTPRYAPPESWDGQESTPAWDVYSAGMVLYEAFAPNIPYDAQTPMGLVKQIIEKPIPRLKEVAEEVSPELSDAVAVMIARDPKQPPQDAAAALELLSQSPEWQHAHLPNRSTIIKRHAPKASESKSRPSRRAALRFSVLAAAVVVIGLAAALILSRRPAASGTEPKHEELLAAPSGAGPYTVFDTVDSSSTAVWPNHLLMLTTENPGLWKALAFESTHLWSMDIAQEGPTTLRLEGYWAGYTDKAASLFQHGEITGAGRWIAPNAEMAVSLEFKNLQDGSRKNSAFMLVKTKTLMPDTDFLARLASADFAQPLLYNEVMPRNLAWGQALETQFLARLSPCVVAPRLAKDAPPIELDGRLEDSAWNSSLLDKGQGLGSMAGIAAEGDAKLSLRYDANGLNLGIRLSHAPTKPQVTLALMPHFDLPVAHSPRWSVLFGKDGIRASRFIKSGKQNPWECPWHTAVAESGDSLEAEVFIPFSDLDNSSAPKPGDRWRLNCTIADGGQRDTKILALWGATDVEAVQQGAILLFGGEEGA